MKRGDPAARLTASDLASRLRELLPDSLCDEEITETIRSVSAMADSYFHVYTELGPALAHLAERYKACGNWSAAKEAVASTMDANARTPQRMAFPALKKSRRGGGVVVPKQSYGPYPGSTEIAPRQGRIGFFALPPKNPGD